MPRKPAPKNDPLPIDLPPFEGRKPDGQVLKLGGKVNLDPRMIAAHRVGDVIYVIGAYKTKAVTHDEDDKGQMDRIEGLKLVRGAVIDQEQGEKLLHEVFAEAGVTLT